MPSDSDLLFHVPFACGEVDEQNKIIRGVSLMTGDLEAEGHDLHVDDTTLAQIHEWAKRRGKVTVKADHKGADGKTFKAIVGYLTNFRRDVDGKKVRGDLELLHSEPLTPKILEMARKMPENFGLSAAFKGRGEKGIGGRQFARCTKLLAVDLVENPAANPDGLFSVPVDSGRKSMADTNSSTNPNPEPTLADIFNLVKAQGEQISALTQRQERFEQEVAAQLQQADEPGLDELATMSDEELDQAGFDVAKVRAAVQDAIDAGELTAEGGAPAGNGNEGASPSNAAPATSGAAMSTKAVKDLIQMEIGKVRKQAREAAEQSEAEQAFAVIEEKVNALAAKNDELVTELATKTAEIKSLRLAVRTGVNPLKPSAEVGVNFAAKENEYPEGTYEHVVTTEFKRLIKTGKPEPEARALAYEFGVKKHTELYAEFRERGGRTIELSAK